MDRLVLAAEEKLAAQDFDSAQSYLQRVAELKTDPSPEYLYLSGLVAQHFGRLDEALQQLSNYVEASGKEAEHYEDALRRITQTEELLQSQEDVAQSREQVQKLKSGGDLAVQDHSGQEYDERIRKLYLADDLSHSLVLYINSQLTSFMYLEGTVKNFARSDREEYSLSLKEPARILVSKKIISPDKNGQSAISVSSLDAFGVNPFVSYRCSSAADQCEIRNPANDEPWIRLANDEAAAAEVSKALTRLIKSLQR